MLKAKLKTSVNRLKEQALSEVSKMDKEKIVFARVTAQEMKKLKLHVLDEEITISTWVKQKIKEI